MHVTREEIEGYFDGSLPESDSQRIESHLEGCADCVAVYEQFEEKLGSLVSILDSSEDDSATRAAAICKRQPPFTLGRYQCVKEIGGGGLGIVYLARDAKLELDVAVKVIRPELTRCPDVRRRFLQEARLAARCHHANIVWIIHLDEDQDELYFSMEYLDGRNLQERLSNRSTLPSREAAELLKTLANAVDFAHSRDGDGIVHRDLKPANILFSRDGIPKIADFGLARRLDDEGLTQYPAVVGTRPYMSPEQDRGAPATKESDVFSLGAVLYQCLVGDPPIRRSDGGFVLPERAVLQHELHAVADRDMAAICLKCLEVEPEARYRKAAELSADLGRWLDGIPVKARHASWAERCLRSCRRNPCATVVLGIATIIVFAALVMVTQSNIRLGEALRDKADALRQSDLDRKALEKTLDQLVLERKKLEETLQRLQATKEQAEQERRGFQRAAYALQLQKAGGLLETAPTVAQRLLDDDVLCPGELRDASWRYLRSLCLQEVEVWEHETEPLCMDSWPERGLFATGDQEGNVRLWQFGASVRTSRDLPDRFRGAVTGVAFSADGCWVAGSSKDGTARMWNVTDLQNPKCVVLLDPKADQINGVAFSPSRDHLATAHHDKKIRIWRIPAEFAKNSEQPLGEPDHVLTEPTQSVAQIVYTSDGRFLISGSDDAQVRVWKTENWEPLVVPDGHRGAVKSVAAHPDPGMADMFATGGRDRRVLLWKICDDSVSGPKELLRFDETVSSLDFDGENLAAASLDGSVQVCDFDRAVSEPRRISHATEVLSLAFGHVGDLLSGARDGKVRRWRSGAGGNPLAFGAHSEGVQGVNGLVFAADGRTLATGGQDGEVRLWSTADGKSLGKLGSFAQPVAGMVSCKDRSRLLWNVAGRTYMASDWDLGAQPTELDLGWQIPSDLGLSGPGDRLFLGFLGDFGAGLKAWPIPSVREVWQPGIEGQVICLAIATDATQGVASSEADAWWFDFMAEVTKTIVLAPRVGSHKVASLAISPDGRLVAIGTDAGTIFLYDARQSRHVATVSGHAEMVRCLAFSPDSRNGSLASGGEDGYVRLWDAEMGFERLALRTRQPVDVVAFSRDGSQFAAGCRDGSVHVWRCNSD